MQNTRALQTIFADDRRRLLSYTVLGAGALACVFAGAAALRHPPAAAPVVAKAPPAAVANPYGPMIVSLGPWARTAATTPTPGAENQAKAEAPETPPPAAAAPQQTAEQAAPYPAVDVPLPPRRPPELKNLASRVAPVSAPLRQAALAPQPPTTPAAPADNRSFFEKIFGGSGVETTAQPAQPAPMGRQSRRQPAAPAQQALAYAPQESTGGLFGGLTSPAMPAPAASGPAPRAGAGTAVYDISAHTVYMPDGTRLEAHSGLREHLDDPRYVHVRMKGPTPPSVYALSPREALFHGVEALRLTPVGGGNVFGRAGLLAHTYMLGPNGDSNGCVSFRDYNAFLQAYKRGEVRRLVVVARM